MVDSISRIQTSMNESMQDIRARNARVEADKAWETSKTRRSVVAIFIYVVAVFLFLLVPTPRPWFDALVPALAYILSTLTLPFFKQWWIECIYKKIKQK